MPEQKGPGLAGRRKAEVRRAHPRSDELHRHLLVRGTQVLPPGVAHALPKRPSRPGSDGEDQSVAAGDQRERSGIRRDGRPRLLRPTVARAYAAPNADGPVLHRGGEQVVAGAGR